MNRELKRLAKQALSGKRGIAAALFILPLAVTVFISLLESLLSLVTGYPLLSETAGDIRGLLGISPWTVAISLGGALAGFVLLVPLDIGIKRWYFRILRVSGRGRSLLRRRKRRPHRNRSRPQMMATPLCLSR